MLLELENIVDQVAPPQAVRLFDVWILGPFLLYVSLKKTPLTSIEVAILRGIAAATVLYNLVEYTGEKKRLEAAAPPAPELSITGARG
jgi:hypothetical protein